MQITRTSMFSGVTRTREIAVTPEQFAAWEAGALIQDAMPNLSASDREFLMTGATDDEWDTLKEPEEEEESPMSEINPPPHTSIPDGPEPTDQQLRDVGLGLAAHDLTDLPDQERSQLDQYLLNTAREKLGTATPPAVPQADQSAQSIAQRIGDAAIENVKAAARNRIAFMCALAAFVVHVNYMYQALGELTPEDFRHVESTLHQLTTGVDLLQARLAAMPVPALQAAE